MSKNFFSKNPDQSDGKISKISKKNLSILWAKTCVYILKNVHDNFLCEYIGSKYVKMDFKLILKKLI